MDSCGEERGWAKGAGPHVCVFNALLGSVEILGFIGWPLLCFEQVTGFVWTKLYFFNGAGGLHGWREVMAVVLWQERVES